MLKLTVYTKSVLQLLALFVAGWFFYTIRGLLVYVLIAALLALITKPVVNFISQKKIKNKNIPRSISAGLVVLFLLAIFIAVAALVIPALASEFMVLTKIDFGSVYQSMIEQLIILQKWFASVQIDVGNLEENIQQVISKFLSLNSAENTISSILGGLGNLAIALFSVVFMLFFFLKEENLMSRIIEDYLNKENAGHLRHILPKIKHTLFRYALGLLAQAVGVFLIIFIGLQIIGVQGALVIAVFGAFLNLIPYIGPILGAILAVVLGLGQAVAIDPEMAFGILTLKIALIFVITQLTDNFVFEPLIFANSINAHPLEIFLVISISGLLGGVLAMIIAVPAYSMLRIILKEFFFKFKFVQSFTKNV